MSTFAKVYEISENKVKILTSKRIKKIELPLMTCLKIDPCLTNEIMKQRNLFLSTGDLSKKKKKENKNIK